MTKTSEGRERRRDTGGTELQVRLGDRVYYFGVDLHGDTVTMVVFREVEPGAYNMVHEARWRDPQ